VSTRCGETTPAGIAHRSQDRAEGPTLTANPPCSTQFAQSTHSICRMDQSRRVRQSVNAPFAQIGWRPERHHAACRYRLGLPQGDFVTVEICSPPSIAADLRIDQKVCHHPTVIYNRGRGAYGSRRSARRAGMHVSWDRYPRQGNCRQAVAVSITCRSIQVVAGRSCRRLLRGYSARPHHAIRIRVKCCVFKSCPVETQRRNSHARHANVLSSIGIPCG
jgi:hypothetical protein